MHRLESGVAIGVSCTWWRPASRLDADAPAGAERHGRSELHLVEAAVTLGVRCTGRSQAPRSE